MTSQSASQHIPEETLEQYSMGRLSDSESEPVEEHLLVCMHCQDLLTETEDFLHAVRAATDQLKDNPEPVSWWKHWWESATALPKPVFAMAACALALLVVLPNRPPNAATVELQTMRGAESAAQAPADSTLNLKLSVPVDQGNNPLQVRVADSAGKIVEQAPVEFVEGQPVARVGGLAAGSYWVRVYRNEEMVSESGLNVR